LEYLIKKVETDIPEFLTMDFILSRIGLLFLIDGLLSQSRLSVDSPVSGRMSVGSGISMVFVEGKKRHYTLRIYAAQALEGGMTPVFYLSLSSSRFKFRESTEL
jgi:hypothetical protein